MSERTPSSPTSPSHSAQELPLALLYTHQGALNLNLVSHYLLIDDEHVLVHFPAGAVVLSGEEMRTFLKCLGQQPR